MDAARQLALLVARVANDHRAYDVVILDLRGHSLVADYFVICSGATRVQVQALADYILEETKKEKYRLLRREGRRDATWTLLDYGPVVVHVMQEDTRRFYDLEHLWGDAPVVEEANNS